MNLNTLQKSLFFISALFAASFSYAADSNRNISYTVTPMFGVETVYRSSPTPHTVTHTMYGVRLTGGLDILSAEIEYTKGSDTENFAVAPEKIKTDDEKLKLGVRSIFRLSDLFNMSVRLGGEAKRTTEESTSGGVSTTVEDPIQYNPYAGAAFGVHIGKMNISIGTTVVIKDVNDMSKNDIQNSIAVGFGI